MSITRKLRTWVKRVKLKKLKLSWMKLKSSRSRKQNSRQSLTIIWRRRIKIWKFAKCVVHFSQQVTLISVLLCTWKVNCILVISKLGKSFKSLKVNDSMNEKVKDWGTAHVVDQGLQVDPQEEIETEIWGGQIAKNNLRESITRNKSYSVQKSMVQVLMYHHQWVNSNMLTWRCRKTSGIVVTSYKWDNKVLEKNGVITRES